jgi:hypothetical protein
MGRALGAYGLFRTLIRFVIPAVFVMPAVIVWP